MIAASPNSVDRNARPRQIASAIVSGDSGLIGRSSQCALAAHDARADPADHRDEADRLHEHEHAGCRRVTPPPACSDGDDAEQQHREDVVDDRGAEDHAALDALQRAELLQHARGDAGRRRHERGRDEQRLRSTRNRRRCAHSVPQRERHDDAEHADQERAAADLLQIVEPRFEADREQQQHDADLGQHVERRAARDLLGADPAERGRADHAAGDDLADDAGQLQPLRDLGADLRGDEDHEEAEQDRGGFVHAMRSSDATDVDRIALRRRTARECGPGYHAARRCVFAPPPDATNDRRHRDRRRGGGPMAERRSASRCPRSTRRGCAWSGRPT